MGRGLTQFRAITHFLWFIALVLSFGRVQAADDSTWFERKTTWQGYEQFHFKVADRAAYLVAPKKPAAGHPWVWRARFPGYHADMDVTLLGKGYHVAYVDVAGLFGSPTAVKIGDAFYTYLTTQRGLSRKPALEGVSRGGLFVYNWAVNNPDKVACIYCDTPVCDFKSWPGGKGAGIGSPAAWRQCLSAYGLTEAESLKFEKNPIDHAEVIAKVKIPILHIVSESDCVVPPKENTYLLQQRLKQDGHDLEVISVPMGTIKSNGHHFDHPEPDRVVSFIAKHTGSPEASLSELLRDSKRIVFLGDSITYAGQYVAILDAWLTTQNLENRPVVINAGLPSETVSGLSEKGHAGGRFPRPDLAERLERVLSATKPDLVLACYGINCGIYQPFDEERFQRYQTGFTSLKKHAESVGAKLIIITPPFYDDQRKKNAFSYNAVLDRYTEWLLQQREKGWSVIDLHGPMTQAVGKRRESNPKFAFQPDAVHPNAEGHWFIAKQLIRAFGDEDAIKAESPEQMLTGQGLPKEVLSVTKERMAVLRNAYLSAAGHQRPGIPKGLPIPEAQKLADTLTTKISELTK